MKLPPRSVLKRGRYFGKGLLETAVLNSSISTLAIMKVKKITVEEIIFSELTLPQFTTSLKGERLHRYFSKFSIIRTVILS